MVRMKFSEEKIDQGYFITSYDEQGIAVNGIVLTSSFVISLDCSRLWRRRKQKLWCALRITSLPSRKSKPVVRA